MTNQFIEKSKRENPFETKAHRRRQHTERKDRAERRRKAAKRNRDELAKLFRRFSDTDDPETRERIRERLVEAQGVVDNIE